MTIAKRCDWIFVMERATYTPAFAYSGICAESVSRVALRRFQGVFLRPTNSEPFSLCQNPARKLSGIAISASIEIGEVAWMPAIGPIKRRELIAYLRTLGFEPPVSGGDRQSMHGRGGRLRIRIPHTEDISRGLLVRILQRGGIDRQEWEAL